MRSSRGKIAGWTKNTALDQTANGGSVEDGGDDEDSGEEEVAVERAVSRRACLQRSAKTSSRSESQALSILKLRSSVSSYSSGPQSNHNAAATGTAKAPARKKQGSTRAKQRQAKRDTAATKLLMN